MARIAVLLSGGVDSAFAALRLIDQGHEVEGFTALLHGKGRTPDSEAAVAAREICRTLSIPHTVVDVCNDFNRMVVSPFAAAYADGMTPNPCAWCNRDIKLGKLADLVRDRGFDFVATGHYARLGRVRGRATLCEPLDRRKSQVYFLSLVDPCVLGFLSLPLGDFRKEDVRRLVEDAAVPARRRDSQDLCFAAGGKYHEALKSGGPQPGPGEVLDTNGDVIDAHKGHTAYTVGQRFGFRGRRYYVLEKRPEANVIVIGERDRALKTRITVTAVNAFLPLAGGESARLTVRYRYNSPPVNAGIAGMAPGRLTIVTATPCFAPAPGQILAGYRNGCLVFGGIIESAA